MPKFLGIFSRNSDPKPSPELAGKLSPKQAPKLMSNQPVIQNVKKQFFIPGKYATENTYNQPMKVGGAAEAIARLISPALGDDVHKLFDKALENPTMLYGQKSAPPLLDSAQKSVPIILQGEMLQQTHDMMDDIVKRIEEAKNNPTLETAPMMGYINFMSKMFDQKNNFTDVDWNSPFIDQLISVTAGMPRINAKGVVLKDLYKALGDKFENGKSIPGPLTLMNRFFNGAADLYDRECEKIRLNDMPNRDPMEEAEYLTKLNNTYKAMLAAYDGLADMVDENGKSVYDQYMNNSLDQIVGKSVADGSVSNRSAREQMAYMRGCQKAIDNGWGMNELGILGHVSLMEKHIELIDKRFKENVRLKKGAPSPEELKRYEEFSKDVRELKKNVWEVSAKTPANKAAVLNSVLAFNEKYKDYAALGKQGFFKTSLNHLEPAKRDLDTELVSVQYAVNSKNLKAPEYTEKDARWLYEAKAKGWPDEFMPVMHAYNTLKEEVEKAKADEKNAANEKFRKWEKEQFAPLKEQIENKQIKSPADVLVVIDALESFRTSNSKNMNTAGTELVQNSLESAKTNMQILWNKAIGMQVSKTRALTDVPNKTIDDLAGAYYNKIRERDMAGLRSDMHESAVKDRNERVRAFEERRREKVEKLVEEERARQREEIKEAERSDKIQDPKTENETMLSLLKEKQKDFTPAETEKIFSQYMRNLVNGKLKNERDREFLDPNHSEYDAYQKALNKEIKSYSKRCLRPLRFDRDKGQEVLPCKVIAAVLENGGHEDFAAQIKDKVAARMKLNQLKELENGDALKSDLAYFKTFKKDAALKDVYDGLVAAEKARNDLGKDIQKKWKKAMDPKTKNQDGLAMPDERKAGKYIDKQLDAYDRIQLACDTYEQKQKDGNATDKDLEVLDRLKKARDNAVKLQNDASQLREKPFTMSHIRTLKNVGYQVKDKEMMDAADGARKQISDEKAAKEKAARDKKQAEKNAKLEKLKTFKGHTV